MGFKDLVIGMVMVGIFAIAIMSFGIIYAQDNESNNSISDSPFISGSFNNSIYSELGEVRETALNGSSSLSQQEAQGGDEGFSLTAIVPTVLTFLGLGFNVVEIVLNSASSIIGIPVIILNVIAGSLLIVLLILAWRVIKAGGT